MHSPRTHNSFLSVLLLQLRIPTVVTFGLCVYVSTFHRNLLFLIMQIRTKYKIRTPRWTWPKILICLYYDIKKQIHIAFHTTFLTDFSIKIAFSKLWAPLCCFWLARSSHCNNSNLSKLQQETLYSSAMMMLCCVIRQKKVRTNKHLQLKECNTVLVHNGIFCKLCARSCFEDDFIKKRSFFRQRAFNTNNLF